MCSFFALIAPAVATTAETPQMPAPAANSEPICVGTPNTMRPRISTRRTVTGIISNTIRMTRGPARTNASKATREPMRMIPASKNSLCTAIPRVAHEGIVTVFANTSPSRIAGTNGLPTVTTVAIPFARSPINTNIAIPGSVRRRYSIILPRNWHAERNCPDDTPAEENRLHATGKLMIVFETALDHVCMYEREIIRYHMLTEGPVYSSYPDDL